MTLGIPRLDTWLKTGAKKFYKVNVLADETMRLTLTAQNKNTENELYTRFGLMPSLSAYDYLYNRQYNSDQEITVPNTQAGNYYSMARAGNLAAVPSGNDPYSIKAEIVPFSITSVSPQRIGDKGQVTITLTGAKFENGSVVKLVHGSEIITAVKVWAIDNHILKSMFILNSPALTN